MVEKRTLQQQVMSFISAGVNTGLWNREIAYDLVRKMLDAQWNSHNDMKSAGEVEGQCETRMQEASGRIFRCTSWSGHPGGCQEWQLEQGAVALCSGCGNLLNSLAPDHCPEPDSHRPELERDE